MAVQEQTPLQEYTANGITKQFDLEFDCESADHLIVSIDDLEVLHTDWYLSGNAIMFHVAPANGKQVKIQRNTPFNRLADYQSYNNSFRPPAINKDFDRIWWKLQELGVADWILGNRISALKAYVDDRDDELRAYLMEEIRKQGVALDQLDEYYNYLMERLAQIAVDKGWDASFVVHNGETQYLINERQFKKNAETISTADYGSIGDGSAHTIREWFDSGKYKSLDAIKIKYPHATSLDNSIDWVAAQKACDVAGQGGAVLIKGCLFFREGEKLVVPARQKLYGLGSPLFINTNNGLMFTGSLTGDLPEYGIYYDGESGSPLRCGEAVILEGFHLFGKGLKVADGSINILQIHDAEYWPTVGVEVEKFIITDNFSVYYFNEAIRSLQGGNYYSKFSKTEITRCSVGFSYEVSAYNQDFFSVTLREVREPFKFSAGAFARGFNYFGGSIEGFRPQVGREYAVGIPANSLISFKGTYFENLENSGIHEAVFSPVGTNAVVQFDACTIYLNHFKNWVKQPNQTSFKVVTRGNEFLLSANSRVKNPTIYNVIQTGTNIATVDTDGSDKIRFVRGYPSIVKSASIDSGSKALVFSDITDIHVGQRIIIPTINLETVIMSIVGNVAMLQAVAPATYTGNVDIYFTPAYLPFSIGLPLLNNRIVYPLDYLSYFDDIQFEKVSGKAVKARSKAPDSVFNGANSGVSTYVADYTSWNPSGKRDGRGAYPVAYRGGKYIPQLGSFTGSFTCSSGLVTIVNDTNVSANSVVLLVPKNSAAANLLKNGFYISEIANSTRFNITFLTLAAGTEEFDYTITD